MYARRWAVVCGLLVMLLACSQNVATENLTAECGTAETARWRDMPVVIASSSLAQYGDTRRPLLEAAGFEVIPSGAPSFEIRAVFDDAAEAARRTGVLEEPGFTVLLPAERDFDRGELVRRFSLIVAQANDRRLRIVFPEDRSGVSGVILVDGATVVRAECFVFATGNIEFERSQYQECLLRGLGLPSIEMSSEAGAEMFSQGEQCLRNLYGGRP